MAKIILSEVLGKKIFPIKESYHFDPNDYLPNDYKDDPNAMRAIGLIYDLLEIINDPNVDQLEGGLSDFLRETAIHMLKSNR